MQRRDRIDGSPHDEACTNIDSHGTANNPSLSRVIRPAIEKRRAGIVPPYLIRQVAAAEVSRYGRAVREIHIVRARCHYSTVTTVTGEEAEGEIRIDATRADFDAAARLYAAINRDGGGQDSKMTRNEAAALATIARMGWETFAVRMLQQATGLSYHQVRRILQGYTAKGTVYCGLSEKCSAWWTRRSSTNPPGRPSAGTTVRRHESHFRFDAERYRERTAGLAASLEEEGPSPPPSGGSGGMPDPCCKGVRNHSRKEIEEGKPQQDKEDLVK